MKILFIHQCFPGQFVHLAADLARDHGNQVLALTVAKGDKVAGVTIRPYRMLRAPAGATHPLLREQESQVMHAEACAAAAFQLMREGFVPDVIIAHSGWGEALFIKDVFPNARLIVYAEYYYAAEGQDVGFDPEAPAISFAQRCRLRLRNSNLLLSLDLADAAITPTAWQRQTFPPSMQDKITVIHDGIDAAALAFNPDASLTLAAGPGRPERQFRPGDEVLTFIARNLDPVRGFQVFMRMLPEVLRRRPHAHAVIVGGNERGYGHAPPDGLSWKDTMLAEVGAQLDMTRVHFVGQLPGQAYRDLLSVSRVHTYWSTPFVLSWSFLEAALSGVSMVASATPPVLEFSPLLGIDTVDFFDQEQFCTAICDKLAQPSQRKVRRVPPSLDLARCLAAQRRLIAAGTHLSC